MKTRLLIAASAALALFAAAPAQAHRQWMLPSSTVLSGDDVWVTVEDAVSGSKSVERFDLVVLATGMQPSLAGASLPIDVPVDAEGFIVGGEEKGIFAAGCAKQPLDVMKSAQSATGAAMKAIQTGRGR